MKFLKIFVLFISFILLTNNSFSIGLGLYTPFIKGGSSHTVGDGNDDYSWNTNYSGYGLGFVLDTKVAEDKLFNYRLNAGYQYMQHTTEDKWLYGKYFSGYDYNFHRIAFDNDIGFGIVRNEVFRLWLGPQLRFGLGYGTGNSVNQNDLNIFYYHFGIGALIGANFHVGDYVSLCLDMGYRYSGYFGVADYHTYSYYNNYEYELNSTTQPILGSQGEFFMNFSVLFRIHDIFKQKTRTNYRRTDY